MSKVNYNYVKVKFSGDPNIYIVEENFKCCAFFNIRNNVMSKGGEIIWWKGRNVYNVQDWINIFIKTSEKDPAVSKVEVSEKIHSLLMSTDTVLQEMGKILLCKNLGYKLNEKEKS